MQPEQIAEICHAANRGLQSAAPSPGIPVAAEWADLDERMQSSILSGVHGVQDGKTPEESHDAWCDFKRADGWVYGSEKNADLKTHPCLVPYDELEESDRIKDSLFAAIVHVLS